MIRGTKWFNCQRCGFFIWRTASVEEWSGNPRNIYIYFYLRIVTFTCMKTGICCNNKSPAADTGFLLVPNSLSHSCGISGDNSINIYIVRFWVTQHTIYQVNLVFNFRECLEFLSEITTTIKWWNWVSGRCSRVETCPLNEPLVRETRWNQCKYGHTATTIASTITPNAWMG